MKRSPTSKRKRTSATDRRRCPRKGVTTRASGARRRRSAVFNPIDWRRLLHCYWLAVGPSAQERALQCLAHALDGEPNEIELLNGLSAALHWLALDRAVSLHVLLSVGARYNLPSMRLAVQAIHDQLSKFAAEAAEGDQ